MLADERLTSCKRLLQESTLAQDDDPITVLIADPHQLFRESLRCLLQTAPGLRVVGEAGNPGDVVPAIEAAHPQVVLFRLDAGSDGSCLLVEELPQVTKLARTLVITAQAADSVYAKAIELGAVGVVSCSDSGAMLIKAIHAIHRGDVWYERSRTVKVLAQLTGAATADPEQVKIGRLTHREREVIGLVMEGLEYRDIGERLHIRQATVRNHLTSILAKLQVRNRFQLVVYGLRHGLGPRPVAVYSVARNAPQR